jgi:RNA polymerase sigma factor (sigma-70 family)
MEVDVRLEFGVATPRSTDSRRFATKNRESRCSLGIHWVPSMSPGQQSQPPDDPQREHQETWHKLQQALPSVIQAVRRRFGRPSDSQGVHDAALSAAAEFLAKPTAYKSRFEDLPDVENWLVVIAGQKYIKYLKRKRRQPIGVDRGTLESSMGDTPELEEFAAVADTFLAQWRQGLTNDERLVLEGRLADQSVAQIADGLDFTPEGVRNIWKRIMRKGRKLRDEFEE